MCRASRREARCFRVSRLENLVNPLNSSWRRTFFIIFTGQAFSLLGSSAVNFALIWWLTVETGSAQVLAYAAIAAMLPQAIVGPFAGPYVDRWDRRLIMIVADLAIAASSLVLIALFAAGRPAVATVILIIAARSLGAAFHTPASQAAIPMYVPAEELMRVAGWSFFLQSGVAMAGPVLGAFLIGVLPVAWVVALDVAGALIAVGSLALVRIPHPQRAADDTLDAGVLAQMAAGWRELQAHRELLALVLLTTAAAFVYIPVGSLFPLMTRSHFDGGALQASVVEVAFGGGMLVGSLFVGVLAARLGGVRLTVSGVLLLGGALIASGLVPSSAFWLFVVASFVMGLSAPAFSAPVMAMLQERIDPSKLGRVMSLTTTIMLVAVPLGLMVAGPAAQRVGVAMWFSISGTLIVAVGIISLVSPTIRSAAYAPERDESTAQADDGA